MKKLFTCILLMVYLSAGAEVIALSDQSSNLIQDYLLQHPGIVINMSQTKDQIDDSILNVSQLSLNDIDNKINNTEPAHVTLPTKTVNSNHDIPN